MFASTIESEKHSYDVKRFSYFHKYVN